MNSPIDEERYPIFSLFCDCLNDDGREEAEEHMLEVEHVNEILSLYVDKKTFDAGVAFARKIEHAGASFVPIDEGGIIYIRCAVPDAETFFEMVETLGEDSREIFATPEDGLDFTMPDPDKMAEVSDALLFAVEKGDGAATARELTALHGDLSELLLLEGSGVEKSIIVFSDGTEIPVGQGTFMEFLTFGSAGPGLNSFSAFLAEAGFVKTDLSGVAAPSAIKADGNIIEGKRIGDTIEWADGREPTPVWEDK